MNDYYYYVCSESLQRGWTLISLGSIILKILAKTLIINIPSDSISQEQRKCLPESKFNGVSVIGNHLCTWLFHFPVYENHMHISFSNYEHPKV